MSNDDILNKLIVDGLTKPSVVEDIPPAVYDKLRTDMLDEFEDRSASPTQNRTPTVIEPDSTDNVISFDAKLRSTDTPSSSTDSFGKILRAVAAAIIIAVPLVVVALIGSGRGEVSTVDEPDEATTTTFVEPQALTIGQLSLEQLPAGVEVLEDGEDRIVLGRVGDDKSPRSTITLVTLDEGTSVAELVAQGTEVGDLTSLSLRDSTLGTTVNRWELRLTNDAVEARGCVGTDPCLPFGPVELWAVSVNNIVAIPTTDGGEILWVEQTILQRDSLLLELGLEVLAGLTEVE